MNRFLLLMASNVDAHNHMSLAENILREAFPLNIRFSIPIETVALSKEGVPKPDAPSYLNAVCEGHTKLDLDEMLPVLRRMETLLGRDRTPAARGMVAIDLDLVEWNEVVVRPEEAEKPYFKACLNRLKTARE